MEREKSATILWYEGTGWGKHVWNKIFVFYVQGAAKCIKYDFIIIKLLYRMISENCINFDVQGAQKMLFKEILYFLFRVVQGALWKAKHFLYCETWLNDKFLQCLLVVNRDPLFSFALQIICILESICWDDTQRLFVYLLFILKTVTYIVWIWFKLMDILGFFFQFWLYTKRFQIYQSHPV